MLSRIEPLSDEESEFSVKEELLGRVNGKIDRLNVLIDRYNRLPEQSPDARLLLSTIYQLQKRYDDSILSELSSLGRGDRSDPEKKTITEQYIINFHKTFLRDLKEQFINQNVIMFTDTAVREWDIATNTAHGSLPKGTTFLGSIDNQSSTTSLQQIAALLNHIQQTPSGDNYYHLLQLREEILMVLATTEFSKADKQRLEKLVRTTNYQLTTQHIPALTSRQATTVSESNPAVMTILNMPSADLLRLVVEPGVSSNGDEMPDLGKTGYNIKPLGQGGNTHNYLLTNVENQTQMVLSIRQSIGNSMQCAQRLSNTAASDYLAPVYCSRSGMQTKDGSLWTVELTDYYAQGDLLSHSSHQADPVKRQEDAADIYSQMADVLHVFVMNNVLFNDMKPTNFLLNDQGQLRIADQKSFVDAPRGIFNRSTLQPDAGNLHTVGFVPPELNTYSASSNINKHQSFLMGLSLYLYLTQKEYKDIISDKTLDLDKITFDDPVFRAMPQGKAYQDLITDLTKTDPRERIGLIEAQTRLKNIQRSFQPDAPGASSAASSSSQAPDSPQLPTISKTGEFRTVLFLKQYLSNYIQSHCDGTCPDGIRKMLESGSLSNIGKIAAEKTSQDKPWSRDEHLHNLYVILSRFAQKSFNSSKILTDAKEHAKTKIPSFNPFRL